MPLAVPSTAGRPSTANLRPSLPGIGNSSSARFVAQRGGEAARGDRADNLCNISHEVHHMGDPKLAAEKAGLNIDDVKKGLERLLPLMKVAAKITPNKIDDAAVAFLEVWLAAS